MSIKIILDKLCNAGGVEFFGFQPPFTLPTILNTTSTTKHIDPFYPFYQLITQKTAGYFRFLQRRGNRERRSFENRFVRQKNIVISVAPVLLRR